MTGVTMANDACCGYEEHQHTDACLTKTTLLCGYPEAEQPVQPTEVPAADPAAVPAAELAADPAAAVPDASPVPDASASLPPAEPAPHVHTDACYQWENQCERVEHIHSVDCYSDPNADVETPLVWQEMFAGYPYTGDLRTDLAGIAKTQVGYTESARNFQADDAGIRHGYTRYGAWYGAPYNDWSAIFVSFCLHYAGADTAAYPTSSGAATMAGLWNAQGKYAPAGQYVPLSGDLIFFSNNTVGIVAEVQSTTVYVISGDEGDAVSGRFLPLNDPSIDGWGMVGRPVPDDEIINDEVVENEIPEDEIPEDEIPEDEVPEDEVPEDEIPEDEVADDETSSSESVDNTYTADELLDISNGPAIFVIEGGTAEQQKMRRFSLRNPRTVTDLSTYLQQNGGSYFFTLLDLNNVELPKDAEGNYIAQANQAYKLSITFNSPNGFAPGIYQYQVPNGLMVAGGEGTIVMKNGTEVGSWVVTDTGLITFVFNDKMNTLTDSTISTTLGINFNEQSNPLDFDGKITVTVKKPQQQQFPTQMLKWGRQGNPENGEDPDKIYWTVQITGKRDSRIPGNILSDQILHGQWSKTHQYTASDIAGGLTIGVSEPDPVTGEFKEWHAWHVSDGDPSLVWTEAGWSYKMPLTATCQWCGEVVLGNENWSYTVQYTSTPDFTSVAGTYGYENDASIDAQHAYGWAEFTHGETHGEIIKNGSFVSDAGSGKFVWEFQAMIPGMKPGQKADYHWYIMDYMYLLSKTGDRDGYLENDADLSTVTAKYQGTTVTVPKVQDAAGEPFAWHNAWTAENGDIGYGEEINLLCLCHCTEDTCPYWNATKGCGTKYWLAGAENPTDYCQCWTAEEDVILTFVYATDALPVIEEHGGFEKQLQNIAELYYKPNGYSDIGALVSTAQAVVAVPSVFQKQLTQDFNGYTAHYQITVNEAKAVLTDGSPLTINDQMTDTLAYIGGSLVIVAEDANGNKTTLQQGTHYTVTYDGSGTKTDGAGNKVHVLEIVILRPQPVKYILDYDTTLVMPDHVTGAIKYRNSASVSLWGQEITSGSVEKTHAEINIAAYSYTVELYKKCALTGKPLPNAEFGLYNAKGGLIASGVTDGNGHLFFQTNITAGIILREHELYYLQEMRAPLAYQLDDTKHWFVFCNKWGDSCETCQQLIGTSGAVRIPFEEIGKVDAVNQPVPDELPHTGGSGTTLYMLCGLMLISAPLVYGLSLRRKYERRSRK